MNARPTISVIIPTYRPDVDQLERAIASVKRHLTDAEIIVVDDGSDPAVGLHDTSIILVQQINRGPSAARNRGAAEASGEWLLFLDDDDEILLPVMDLVNLINPAVGLAWGGFLSDRNGDQHEIRADFPSIPGASLVSRKCFHAVGGYDEALHFGENTDLYIRLMDITSTASTNSIVLKYNTNGKDPYRYSRKVVDSVEHVIKRGRSDLSRRNRARLHGIAAVNASRSHQNLKAVRHALRSTILSPRPRSIVRILLCCVGPIGQWRWGRITESRSF